MSYQAFTYRHAADLPESVWKALSQYEAAANVVLPFAKKAKNIVPGSDDDVQLWIALYNDATKVAFVLSCTKGSLGDYPIFIVACKSPTQLAQENLTDAMLPLVQSLLNEVSPQRVFSVFAYASVAEAFVQVFEGQVSPESGIRVKGVYYDATLTFCSSDTLNKSSACVSPFPGSDDVVIASCRADMSHLDAIKVMCREFSETSPPFVLDDTRAELEARTMIANQQVWVHLVQENDGEAEIACLVAATRESDNVTAISKVYTPERWRGKGCAARLLHRVCQELLQKKKEVVLFVGNSGELAPARRVYNKIGFQGLNGHQEQQLRGVEKWLEVGFTSTSLGHW